MSIKLAEHKGASRLSVEANGGPVVYCAVLLASKPGCVFMTHAPCLNWAELHETGAPEGKEGGKPSNTHTHTHYCYVKNSLYSRQEKPK